MDIPTCYIQGCATKRQPHASENRALLDFFLFQLSYESKVLLLTSPDHLKPQLEKKP